MIRILLLFVVSLGLPVVLYILWRTFAPTRLGGSEAIEREEWEPLPWPWLAIAGGVLLVISLVVMIVYPDLFGA
jgi:hypothetical protein